MSDLKLKCSRMLAALGLGSALLLSGCATTDAGSDAAPSGDFAAQWEAAEAKRKEAAAVGYEWRDTGKMLKNAQKEADAGNMEKALALVAQAHEESMDALAQEKREGELWQSRVPQ